MTENGGESNQRKPEEPVCSLTTPSQDPISLRRTRWGMRWNAVLNAFAITFPW
jgi:hypothetical protein